jgi:hypothetical protein
MPPSANTSPLWRGVECLLATADAEGLVANGLGPLGAELRRRRGDAVSPVLADEQRAARFSMLCATGLLKRLRTTLDGPIMLLKGPEVALRYPAGARRFGDVDILVPDAQSVHTSLRADGFDEVPEPEGLPTHHHHLEPLRLPTIPLLVEVHSSPNWLAGMRPPQLDELFEAAVPSSLGVAGILAPSRAHHTLMLASHAWRDEALRRVRDLVDVAAMAEGIDRRELDRLARAWGMRRVWNTTEAAIEGVLRGGKRTFPLRSWARHLPAIRERTVLEHHLARWMHPYWETTPRQALGRTLRTAAAELAPADGETWSEKGTRTLRALRSPSAPVVRLRDAPSDRGVVPDPGSESGGTT